MTYTVKTSRINITKGMKEALDRELNIIEKQLGLKGAYFKVNIHNDSTGYRIEYILHKDGTFVLKHEDIHSDYYSAIIKTRKGVIRQYRKETGKYKINKKRSRIMKINRVPEEVIEGFDTD